MELVLRKETDGFSARVLNMPEASASGESVAHAIGALVEICHDRLGIEIAWDRLHKHTQDFLAEGK